MTPPPLPSHWRRRDEGLEPGAAVVFDVDGVLSDAASRQHYLEGPGRDWDAFFEACGDDPVIAEVARLTELLDPTLSLVLLTARPVRVRPQTLAWLACYGLRWDLLIMREGRSYAPAREFKRASVRRLRELGWDPLLAFEDDRRNVEMFHDEGVSCIYIHSGYYE